MNNSVSLPHTFRIGRLASLQPKLAASELARPPEALADPVALNDLKSLLAVWSHDRPGVPLDFADQFSLSAVQRHVMAAVGVELQQVRRWLSKAELPYTGGQVNSREWADDDLFSRAPVDAPFFPPEAVLEATDLSGGESVEPCDKCKSNGSVPCTPCNGKGKVSCKHCGGKGTIACDTCRGLGQLLRSGQAPVACVACQGKGAIGCSACAAQGTNECANCKGSGQTTCDRCQGARHLHQRWRLHTKTSTESTKVFLSHNTVPIPAEEFARDADQIWQQSWPWPEAGRDPPVPPELSPELAAIIHDQVQHELRSAGPTDKHLRVAGLRLEIFGTYGYNVTFDYRGQTGRIFVCGQRGHVVPMLVPRAGIWLTLLGWLDRLTTKLRLNTGLMQLGHTDAVRGDRAYVSDLNDLGPQLQKMGHAVHVTSTGYRVKVSSQNGSAVPFDIQFTAGLRQELSLMISTVLGRAQRPRLPQVLADSRRLRFGRLALRVDPATGEEWLMLVDRRGYRSLTGRSLACLLTAMAEDVKASAHYEELMESPVTAG